MAKNKEVKNLKSLIAKQLHERISSGEFTAADMSNAINFVKFSNGFVDEPPTPGEVEGLLEEASRESGEELPFPIN